MKTVLLALVTLIVAAGLVWVGWALRGVTIKPPSPTASPTIAPVVSTKPVNQSPVARPRVLTPEDWQKIRNAREAVLQSNTALAAEYKELLGEMQAQQDEVNTAMIKADPKVAPIIAKFGVLRQYNGTTNSTPPAN